VILIAEEENALEKGPANNPEEEEDFVMGLQERMVHAMLIKNVQVT
jgi:hypothetical protein